MGTQGSVGDCNDCCFFRKGPPMFYGWMQQFIPQHEETDGTHEAASQAQHLLPVSSIPRLHPL